MSQTDSFIEEVTEEVRRDRLFKALRKYGWIGVVAVLLIVGGTAWTEFQKAQERAAAESVGDSILTALEPEAPDERIAALQAIDPEAPGAAAVVAMLVAAEEDMSGDSAAASQTLRDVSAMDGLPPIYRDIMVYKAIVKGGATLPADQRRLELDALARAGNPLRLLAEEQLALIEIETGDTEAALDRLQRILVDAEVSTGLRTRASQLIVALGGSIEPA